MDVFANKCTFEAGIKLVATSMLKKKISPPAILRWIRQMFVGLTS